MSQTLKDNPKYTYNTQTEKYIFHTYKKFGRNIVLTKDAVNTLIMLYSNYDKVPHTMGEISLKMSIPKEVLKHILYVLQITHDSIPFTQEKVDNTPEEELVEEMENNKKFNILQKFEKRDWNQTVKDAEKWREIQGLILSPIKEYLETINIPKKALRYVAPNNNQRDNAFFVGFSDTHFGNQHLAINSFNNKVTAFDDVIKSFEDYALKIKQDVYNRKNKFNKCYIIAGGDILHSLTGYTDKGTKLSDGAIWGTDQFKLAFETLADFIQNMYDIFGRVDVKSVGGNHAYIQDYILFYTLQKYFEYNKNINFDIATCRWLSFNVGKTLFLMDHGNSSKMKFAMTPEHGQKREAYIQSLFYSAERDGKYKDISNRVYIMGDKHNIQYGEYNDFEFIRFSTSVIGDPYADEKVLKNRPRFNAFIIDNNGIKEVLNYYVD